MSKNNFLKKISTCFFLLASLFAFSQQKVSGKVTDAVTGDPLPSVTILLKGTSSGTTTDFDGNYTITTKTEKDALTFSYLGYKTQEVLVGGKSTIDVAMKEDASALDEIVVVGYGARRKSDVTGSVSSVKAEELNAFPVLDAAQAMQGRAAGVVVQSNNGGEPGAPISIQIRGNTSINASSNPLIVVDGFVGATMPQAGDIASIEILKDASSTAIYGSQGANGVVMVTTKKGRSGKMNFEINSTYSVQNTANKLDLLNADDFADYQNIVRENVAITRSIDAGETVSAVPYVQGDSDSDWQDLIYRAGSTANHQFSFSGGTDKTNYYASLSYFKQDGILVNSDYERVAFLTNINSNLTDKLKVGLNLSGSLSQKSGVSTQSDGSVTVGGDDVVSLAMRFAPDKGVYNSNGSFSTNDQIGDEVDNPWAVATQRVDETDVDNFRANFFVDYEIIEGLNFKTTLGLSTNNAFRGRYSPRTLKVTAEAIGGRGIVEDDKTKKVLTESFLTYKKEIGKGVLSLLGGFSYQRTIDKDIYSEGTGTLSDALSYYGLFSATTLINGTDGDLSYTEKEIQSQFGRVNYDFDDKYLITATVRRDEASNFAANEKVAIFPSAALGWKVSNEEFLADSNIISNLKLRASYGVTGNPSINAYESLPTLKSLYASNNGNSVDAFSPERPSNPDLKWESSYQSNFGIDLGLLDNKIILSADYYNIDTKDIIMANQGIPDYAGFLGTELLANVGEINNKGFEISLNTRNISKDNFTWTTDVVFSRNKNTVEKLVGGIDFFNNGAPSYFSADNNSLLREGEEVGLFYGYDYIGVYDGGTLATGTGVLANASEGDPLFLDVDNDGDIDTDDRTIIGNPNPDFTWGITNNFSYKNFDFNIFVQGSQGGDIFNMTAVQLNNGDSNTTYDYYNNQGVSEPRAGNNSSREISSRFVEDGSYVRLKNIAVGYNLPFDVISNLGISNLRLSLSAQNLLTFTKYSGLDPEVNYTADEGNNDTNSNTIRGFDFGNYPTVKSVSFSVNVKF